MAEQSGLLLSTGMRSKGLGVANSADIDTHEERNAKRARIDMAYLSDAGRCMLQSSFVQLLMDFDDKTHTTKNARCVVYLASRHPKNLNVCRVTRARSI